MHLTCIMRIRTGLCFYYLPPKAGFIIDTLTGVGQPAEVQRLVMGSTHGICICLLSDGGLPSVSCVTHYSFVRSFVPCS
jgi:hypothetical protein